MRNRIKLEMKTHMDTYRPEPPSSRLLCPDCGGSISVIQLNKSTATVFPGAQALFFCRNEMGCGWSEAVDEPLWRCALYFSGQPKEPRPFKASEIKEFLTPGIR